MWRAKGIPCNGKWAGEYDEAGRLWKETGRPGINKEYQYDATGLDLPPQGREH
jgi:hypothetical protein